MNVPTWVVGSGGLLGSSVARELERRGADIRTSRVPWGEPALAREILFADARKLVTDAAGGLWRMAWCAGAGVNGTSSDEFARENQLMKDVLDELGTADAGVGTVFHASSAGGVYAGAPEHRTPKQARPIHWPTTGEQSSMPNPLFANSAPEAEPALS